MADIVPDGYQSAVIQSAAKDIVVQAGAGSGKTFTLLSRIHRLVTYCNVDPERILVLTFTRVAAEHMRDKYLKVQDSQYDAVPDFNTFHAFCYKVLSEYPGVAQTLGFNAVPDVASDMDMQRYKLQAKDDTSCTLSFKQISRPWTLHGKNLRMYENYCKRLSQLLKRANVIDYDTLNEKVCQLFVDDDECVVPVKERYLYLFVDEFQDTDEYQFNFVKSMQHCNRVLCGDALQNIYQFRGCSNKPLKQLLESDSWVTYTLPVNYRSSFNICSYVNSMSEKFRSKKYRVELKSTRKGPCVRECFDMNEDDTYSALAKYCKICSKSGSVAVLCRTNKEVQSVADAFKRLGVNFSRNVDSEYAVNVLEACDSDAVKYRWAAANMSDMEYALYRKLKLQGMQDEEIFESKCMYFPSTSVLLSDIASVTSVLESYSVRDATFMLCDMFDAPLPDNEFEANEQLLAYLKNKVQSSPESSVHVGTIHSVKGLEYDSVAVANVNGNAFKIKNEENENLLYTACTRARKNLIVFYQSA